MLSRCWRGGENGTASPTRQIQFSRGEIAELLSHYAHVFKLLEVRLLVFHLFHDVNQATIALLAEPEVRSCIPSH